MTKPIIGITCSMVYQDEKRVSPTTLSFDYLKRVYFEAIENFGAAPVLLPNLTDLEFVEEWLKIVKGILVSGGEDVHPSFYGEEIVSDKVEVSQERDYLEIEFVKKAKDKEIPVLGICRGPQVINVAFGGSLYQDLSFRKEFTLDHTNTGIPKYSNRHEVVISEKSQLFKLLGKEKIWVNTYHHQIIKDTAPDLVATAWSQEDQVIEGIEHKSSKIMGVQWHPEMMLEEESSQRLFKWLIDEAGKL
ncbi:MAG: hypothetical protein A2145_03085 [candidate division Zixibacteria bacterium RBG_16_40_9]|nr:MAG: hypothetical protein A2145_03085 [candidate division Zixibacteria bacterium RBG_16_40_9]